jgi:hypothetical protein
MLGHSSEAVDLGRVDIRKASPVFDSVSRRSGDGRVNTEDATRP